MLRRPGGNKSPNPAIGKAAISFDGANNYVTLTTLGTLGADIGTGNSVYISIDYISTDGGTNVALFGTVDSGVNNTFRAQYNAGGVSGKMSITLEDSTGKHIDASFTNIILKDGTKHTLVIVVVPSTNTVTATIDGASQAITYTNQQTPNTFVNFPFEMYIGAQNNQGAATANMICKISDCKIGVSAGNLYGKYAINEGTGTTIADTSGKGNTGTLSGSPLPAWVVI